MFHVFSPVFSPGLRVVERNLLWMVLNPVTMSLACYNCTITGRIQIITRAHILLYHQTKYSHVVTWLQVIHRVQTTIYKSISRKCSPLTIE